MKTTLQLLFAVAVLFLSPTCKKHKEEAPQPYASFTIGGTSYTFKSASNFNKICVFSHFCGAFSLSKEQSDKNFLFLGLPSDVKSGKVLKTGDSHFEFVYHSADTKVYTSHAGGHMQVMISLWGGNGGWVSGTFSGSLPLEGNPQQDSVVIQNGRFEGKIWYIE